MRSDASLQGDGTFVVFGTQMLLAFIAILAAIVVLVVILGEFGRRHLDGVADAAKASESHQVLSRLPWIKILAILLPFYLAAMYWASVTYDPELVKYAMPGVSNKSEVLKRPYERVEGSTFAAIAHDFYFADEADSIDQKERSSLLLFEDGKLLGPSHSSHADIVEFGNGRFSHWKGTHPVFVFSSSDNTDPHTNGRIYWAERPRVKSR